MTKQEVSGLIKKIDSSGKASFLNRQQRNGQLLKHPSQGIENESGIIAESDEDRLWIASVRI